MRRFRFPLKGLLRLRGHAERHARRSLGSAQQRLSAIEHRLEVVGQGLRECQDQARGADAAARLAMALEVGLRRMQWRVEADKRAAEANLERSRQEYLERRKELRTMERLRDKRRAEWLRDYMAAEQAELDELSRLGRQAREREEIA